MTDMSIFSWIPKRPSLAVRIENAKAHVRKLLGMGTKMFDLPEVDYDEYLAMKTPPRCLATSRTCLEYLEGDILTFKAFKAIIFADGRAYRCTAVTQIIRDMTPGKECVIVSFMANAVIKGTVVGFVILNEAGDCMENTCFAGNPMFPQPQDSFFINYFLRG